MIAYSIFYDSIFRFNLFMAKPNSRLYSLLTFDILFVLTTFESGSGHLHIGGDICVCMEGTFVSGSGHLCVHGGDTYRRMSILE